eukprot:jgi/Ulvmu1/10093/UM006_0040.1
MAKFFGCAPVCDKIRQWLQGALAREWSDTPNTGSATSTAVRQVLDALPDDEFSVALKQPNQLVATATAAVALPSRLLVKWLRADCLVSLDLCALDDGQSHLSGEQ